MRHNNIVSFYGITVEPKRIGIITEYCPGGTLTSFIQKSKNSFPFSLKIQMLLDISHGMQYLHAKDVIHRDLKTDNVLVHRNQVCKVSDFGISKFVQEQIASEHTKAIGYS